MILLFICSALGRREERGIQVNWFLLYKSFLLFIYSMWYYCDNILLSDEVHQQEANPSWGDDDCGIGDQFDDGNAYSDVDDSLVSQPRQVCLLKLQFDN